MLLRLGFLPPAALKLSSKQNQSSSKLPRPSKVVSAFRLYWLRHILGGMRSCPLPDFSGPPHPLAMPDTFHLWGIFPTCIQLSSEERVVRTCFRHVSITAEDVVHAATTPPPLLDTRASDQDAYRKVDAHNETRISRIRRPHWRRRGCGCRGRSDMQPRRDHHSPSSSSSRSFRF